jgi:hypothetical protein
MSQAASKLDKYYLKKRPDIYSSGTLRIYAEHETRPSKPRSPILINWEAFVALSVLSAGGLE